MVLYRTNSYTGNTNPFVSVQDALYHAYRQYGMVVIASLSEIEGTKDSPNGDMLDGYENEEFWEQAINESEGQIFYDILLFTSYVNYKACWFSDRERVLSRTSGYGINMCKEDGLLKCYDEGIILVKNGFDTLYAFKEEPKLHKDTLMNSKLATRADIIRLRELEEAGGRLLATTSLKKDVSRVLALADTGMLGQRYELSWQQQEERKARLREQMLDDILD